MKAESQATWAQLQSLSFIGIMTGNVFSALCVAVCPFTVGMVGSLGVAVRVSHPSIIS